jgi:hypothetical protein
LPVQQGLDYAETAPRDIFVGADYMLDVGVAVIFD